MHSPHEKLEGFNLQRSNLQNVKSDFDRFTTVQLNKCPDVISANLRIVTVAGRHTDNEREEYVLSEG